jgi:4-hydroxybenzoate polyprenyltransferase
MTASTFTDIQTNDWVGRWLPLAVQPYARLMRLDRPVGIWLLLWPGLWALALYGAPMPDVRLVLLFVLGSVLMRGAGCVINDLFDRDINRQVARTRTRPLASGAVTARQALVFLIALLLISFAVLLQMTPAAIALGIVALVPITLYPLMKRITWWPQAFLGLTFNWGALLGAAAATGTVPLSAFLLYVAGFFWTLGYDTLYAHADKEDDALIGVKSTARRLGDASPRFIAACYAGTVLLLAGAFFVEGLAWPAYGGLALGAWHLFFQLKNWQMSDPAACIARFKSNQITGLIVFLAVVCGRLLG